MITISYHLISHVLLDNHNAMISISFHGISQGIRDYLAVPISFLLQKKVVLVYMVPVSRKNSQIYYSAVFFYNISTSIVWYWLEDPFDICWCSSGSQTLDEQK